MENTKGSAASPADKNVKRGSASSERPGGKLPVKVMIFDGDGFRDGGASPPKDPLMTLAQVAAYLSISLDYARHVWPEWVEHGINPIRLNGKTKGPLRFKQSEILVLVDSWRVVTKQ